MACVRPSKPSGWRLPGNTQFEGFYTDEGVPTHLGRVGMEHFRCGPQEDHPYRCRRERCQLRARKVRRYCDQEAREDLADNLRQFGPIRHVRVGTYHYFPSESPRREIRGPVGRLGKWLSQSYWRTKRLPILWPSLDCEMVHQRLLRAVLL